MGTLLQYIFVDILAIVFMYIADKNKYVKLNRNIFIFLSASVLLIQLIFRDTSVGTDYKAYIKLYLSINSNTQNLWTGDVWIYLCRAFKYLFGNRYLIFFGSISLLTIIFFYKAILFENKSAFLGLAVYLAFCLYYQSFNQFRQMLAVSIVLYSWKYIKQRKAFCFIFCVFLAACFHMSALVVLPIYCVANLEIDFKHVVLYAILCIVMVYSIDNIYNLFGDTMYVKNYINTSFNSSFTLSAILNTGVRFGLLLGCMLFKNGVLKNDASAKGLYNIAIICMIVQIMAINSMLFARVSTYFFAFYIILIPKVVKVVASKVRGKGFIYILFFAMLLIYHNIYYFNTAKSYGYELYKFIQL